MLLSTYRDESFPEAATHTGMQWVPASLQYCHFRTKFEDQSLIISTPAAMSFSQVFEVAEILLVPGWTSCPTVLPICLHCLLFLGVWPGSGVGTLVDDYSKGRDISVGL